MGFTCSWGKRFKRGPSIGGIGRLAKDRFCSYPPGEPSKEESAQDIEGIVYVLDQQERGHTEGDQQGQPFIHPAG